MRQQGSIYLMTLRYFNQRKQALNRTSRMMTGARSQALRDLDAMLHVIARHSEREQAKCIYAHLGNLWTLAPGAASRYYEFSVNLLRKIENGTKKILHPDGSSL